MKKNYVIDDVSREIKENNAGYKARDDVNDILAKEGYEVSFFLAGKTRVSRFLNYFRLAMDVKLNSNVVLVQYPYYIQNTYKKIIKYWMPNTTILLIHDIDSLRNNLDESEIKKEIALFNQYSCIISHNEFMTKWLKENGCKSKIVNLEIFDYLVENKIKENKVLTDTIAFAGNLSKEKSGFLYNENLKNLSMNVYGGNYEKVENKNLHYQGSFLPGELPLAMNEMFGLVWDGKSINECLGNFGRYLKYNNPHKTSLYLAANIPVIIWKEAAIAKFIEKNKLGFTISSIDEISDILSQLDQKDYDKMKENVFNVSSKIKEGFFLKNAIKQCLETEK